jgi:hypothetical protein
MMELNIKNPEVERLATELASLTGASKTEAVRRALRERQERLALNAGDAGTRATRMRRLLEQEIWPVRRYRTGPPTRYRCLDPVGQRSRRPPGLRAAGGE